MIVIVTYIASGGTHRQSHYRLTDINCACRCRVIVFTMVQGFVLLYILWFKHILLFSFYEYYTTPLKATYSVHYISIVN